MAVRTRNGRVVTDEDLDRMAADAEAGYDLSTWTPRRGRPPLDAGPSGSHAPRLSTRVPQGLHDDVVMYAAEAGMTVSQLLRSMIEGYVLQRSTGTRKRDDPGSSRAGGPAG